MAVFNNANRLGRKQRRRTLDEILSHMQKVADDEYEGDLQANVLDIFRVLPDDEQKAVLRRSLVLQWERMLVESKEELSRSSGFYSEDTEDDNDPSIHKTPAEDSVEKMHEKRLNMWKDLGVRVVLIALIVSMFSMLFSTILLDKSSSLKDLFGLLDLFISIQ